MSTVTPRNGKYICEFCDKQLCRSNVLKKHIQIFHTNTEHNVKNPINCKFCNKVLSRPSALERHVATFHKTSNISDTGRNKTPSKHMKCPECPELLSRADTLKKHMVRKHNQSSEKIHFQFCNAGFKTRYNLQDHQIKCKRR